MFERLAFAAFVPSPTPTVDSDLVTPGPVGFLWIALVAVAVILLALDMLRRVRHVRYREEANELLDAEQAEAAEHAGEAPSEDDPRRRAAD